MLDLSISLYDLEYFLLIFTRVSCFVFIAPFFSLSGVPRQVRIGISFFASILLYQVLSPAEVLIYNSLLEYAIIIVKEAISGLLIGFGANICMSVVNFAGSIADMETGLAMATLMDPATNQNTSITGVLYQYAFMMMLIASGMYRYLFGALADTFKLIPVGGVRIDSGALVDTAIKFLGDYILIGFRIVLPMFCVILLMNAVLGVMAKVSPQMNMFAVGIQLKMLAGLTILFIMCSMLSNTSDFLFREMQEIVASFVDGLM